MPGRYSTISPRWPRRPAVNLDQVVKLTVFLTDLGNFATVNTVMADYFSEPFPARAAVGVASLPKGVDIEADAILAL